MSDFKGTPGPWKADAATGGPWFIYRPDDGSGTRSFQGVGEIYRTHDAGDANARLIAAAPELLGALERLLEEAELAPGLYPCDCCDREDDCPWCTAAQAAAKATSAAAVTS